MVRRLGEHRYDRRVRVVILVSMAVICAGRGAAYLTPSFSGTDYLSMLDPLIPIQVWAGVWVATAAALLWGIRCPHVARWAMSTAAMLWAAWCVSYLAAQVFLDVNRAWVTAMPFGMLAVLTVVFTYLMEPPEAILEHGEAE